MSWSNALLYAHLMGLQRLFTYKQISKIKLERLPELSSAQYSGLAFRKHSDFIVSQYTELANLINSGTISIELVDLYYLGEYIKTGEFPDIKKFNNQPRFSKCISEFYSSVKVSEQIDSLTAEQVVNNTALAKFTKTAKNVFELDEKQQNIAYQMLISGKINAFVYAYFMAQKKFEIDFTKIKDVKQYTYNKIAEYLSTKSIEKIIK